MKKVDSNVKSIVAQKKSHNIRDVQLRAVQIF